MWRQQRCTATANAMIVLGDLRRGFPPQESARVGLKVRRRPYFRHLELERIVQDDLQCDWESASQRSREFIVDVELVHRTTSPNCAGRCWH